MRKPHSVAAISPARPRTHTYSAKQRLAAVNVLHAHRFEWSGEGTLGELVDEVAFALGLWRAL